MSAQSLPILYTQANAHPSPIFPTFSQVNMPSPSSSENSSSALFAAFRLAQLVNSFRRRIKTRVLSHGGAPRKEKSKSNLIVQQDVVQAFQKQAFDVIDKHLGRSTRRGGKGYIGKKKTKVDHTRSDAAPPLFSHDATVGACRIGDEKTFGSALAQLDAKLSIKGHVISEIAADSGLLLERGTKVDLRQHSSRDLLGHLTLIEYLLSTVRLRYQHSHDCDSLGQQDEGVKQLLWYEDELYLANLEYLLLCLQGQVLITLFVGNASAEIIRHIIECQRQKVRSFKQWFFEFPDARHPLSTTWPWSIRPSLAVIWGVCWMFIVENVDGPDINNEVDRNNYDLSCYDFDENNDWIDRSTGRVLFTAAELQSASLVDGISETQPQQFAATSSFMDSPMIGLSCQSLAAPPLYATSNRCNASTTAGYQGTAHQSLHSLNSAAAPAHVFSGHDGDNAWSAPRDNNQQAQISAPAVYVTWGDSSFPGRAGIFGHSQQELPWGQNNNPANLANNFRPLPLAPFSQAENSVPEISITHPFTYQPSDNPFTYSSTTEEDYLFYQGSSIYYEMAAADVVQESREPQPSVRVEEIATQTQQRARSLSSISNELLDSATTQDIDPQHSSGKSPTVKRSQSPEDAASPFPKREKPRSKPTIKDGKYVCDVCSIKPFDRRCEWNKHMDKHDRPYVCKKPECSSLQGFTYSGGLLRHQREVHGLHGGAKLKLYCKIDGCKRKTQNPFTRRENLAEHLRRVHKLNTPEPTSPTSPNSQATNNEPSPEMDEDVKDDVLNKVIDSRPSQATQATQDTQVTRVELKQEKAPEPVRPNTQKTLAPKPTLPEAKPVEITAVAAEPIMAAATSPVESMPNAPTVSVDSHPQPTAFTPANKRKRDPVEDTQSSQRSTTKKQKENSQHTTTKEEDTSSNGIQDAPPPMSHIEHIRMLEREIAQLRASQEAHAATESALRQSQKEVTKLKQQITELVSARERRGHTTTTATPTPVAVVTVAEADAVVTAATVPVSTLVSATASSLPPYSPSSPSTSSSPSARD